MRISSRGFVEYEEVGEFPAIRERYLRPKTRNICACPSLLYLDAIENPRAYLFRIAHNLLYQHYTMRRETTETEVDSLECGRPEIEQLVTTSIRYEQINHAMQELSPKCQRALTLRWRGGFRVAEIAEEMTLSKAMVKKYLAQGLIHFKTRLKRFVLADLQAEQQ